MRPRPSCRAPRPTPGPLGITLPIRTRPLGVSNSGSIRSTNTLLVRLAVGLVSDSTTHTPAGARRDARRRAADRDRPQRLQRPRIDARDGLVVEVRDPQRPRTERDRGRAASRPRPAPTTRFVCGSIAATEFGATRTVTTPPPASPTIARRDRRREQQRATSGDQRPSAPAGAPRRAFGRPSPGCRRGRRLERRVVSEDPLLERSQLRAGLQPELVVERLRGLCGTRRARRSGARTGTAPASAAPAAAHGAGAAATSASSSPTSIAVVTEHQVGLDPILQRGQARFLQPRDLALQRTAHTRDRRAARRATAPAPRPTARAREQRHRRRARDEPSAAIASKRSAST